MSDDALLSDPFIESLSTDNVVIFFLSPTPPEGQDELASEYEVKFGESLSFTFYSFTYDATNMILDAIEAIAVQEEDGTLHIGRQALREALYATSGFEGATGIMTCDEFGDCGTNKLSVLRLDGAAANVEAVKSNVIYTYTPGQ
jgi:branched-chain amino acid transport system substrate-binding protein